MTKKKVTKEKTVDKNYQLHEQNMKMLVWAANAMAIRFLSPTYLVGSYTKKDKNEAHDIDLIMVVTDKRWDRLFGKTNADGDRFDDEDRIYSFRRKQKLFFEEYVSNMDIDFKVMMVTPFKHHKGTKIKLDTRQDLPE